MSPLLGLDAVTGHFQTHATQEYTPESCEALARSFIFDLKGRNDRISSSDSFDPWEAYNTAFVPSDFYVDGLAKIPRDFAG